MSNRNVEFENLKPINDMNLGIYENAIKYAMENDEIHNIAISGPYGSGKSSVIESYKEKEENFKCTHISLSHFESGHLSKVELSQKNSSNEESKNKKEKLQFNENILEGKILNQLIHQTKSKEIPQTNFKIKKKVKKKSVILITFLIILFFISLTHVLMFNKWSTLVNTISNENFKNFLKFSTKPESIIISILICIIILAIGIYSLIKLQKTRGIFKKVNISGTEIEIFEESEESYFDKYLNEVLYIFDHTDTNIIIFEDIDRYNVNEIFGKLREINTLINNNREKGKKLRFFYLLKDDIFTSKDRTKFFDFIIPIVPVIDSSNSYDKFRKLLKKGALIDEFNEQFLQELSLYIDDMRLLKNIYNEFLIYYQKISDIEIDYNKLLAIITYKNIFPKDFSDLQLNSGFVYKLFESKPKFIEEELSKLEEELKNINDEIQKINDEKLESINELEALYIIENIEYKNQQYSVNSTFNSRKELINAIKENEQDFIYLQKNRIGQIERKQINISEILKKINSNENYVKRKRTINQKKSGEIDILEKEKQKIENEKMILQSNKLKNIITRENIDNIFNINSSSPLGKVKKFSDIKGNHYFNLIKYLLRNGWIDEDYETYMTHFYSDSLSSIDKNYLLSITNQLPKDYTYELMDPEKVLSKISEGDFNNQETLNIDLLDYLLKTEEKNTKYLSRLLKQIKTAKNIDFINEFMNKGIEIESFIKNINIEWPEIFQYIIYEDSVEEKFIKEYAINSFYYSSEKEIEQLNKNADLSEWLSNSNSFLEITNPNIDKIIKSLLQIKVKFKWVNPEHANKELFEAVYRNHLYELNISFINVYLEKMYGYPHSLDFIHKNYTLIAEKENEPLAIYVRENFREYLKIVLENCDKQISDDYEIAIQILSKKEIDIEIKERYINYLETEIIFIEEIKDEKLWTQLLQQNKIKYSVVNILNYYFENELNQTLIDFINSQDEEFSFNNNLINEEYDEEFIEKFIHSIMICNEIQLKKYEMIMQQANVIPNFSEEEILDEKIKILIDLDIIPMNEFNLIFMREKYPNMLRHFIIYNIKDYVKRVTNEENFVHDEMLSLLNEDIDEGYKLALLQYSSHEISIESENYSDSVKLHILEHNLDESELESLLYNYANESKKMKKSLLELSINYIEIIVSNEYQLPYSLLIDIFNKRILNHPNEKELLILAIPNMKLDEVKECLSILKMDDFLSLFDKKRPTFIINKTNETFLTIFKERNWITKFYVDEKNSDYYRANGRDLN